MSDALFHSGCAQSSALTIKAHETNLIFKLEGFEFKARGQMTRKLSTWALAWLLVLFAGCSPFSKAVRQQVDERLSFAEVQKNPDEFIGKKVLWGGVIIETTNTQAGTLIKVRQTDLDFETKPKDLDVSHGRFLVHYNGFLDPAIYAADREITLYGEIVGKQDFPLGETRYSYPVVLSKELHLWEKITPYPNYDFYDPWFWGYYPYPWFYAPQPYGWHRW
jgi:outer membrane lipoprotein